MKNDFMNFSKEVSMKKTAALLLSCYALTIQAADTGSNEAIQKARMEWSKKYLAEKNMPVPDGGIKIIPEKQMSSYNKFKAKKIADRESVAQYGYIKERSEEAQRLFNFKKFAADDYQIHGNNYKPTSTHLKHTVNELKIAYTFIGVPKSEISELIGVAPYLSYIKGKGWVGASEFFIKQNIGTCFYSENNIKLSHGSVVIAKEDVRNDVNDKPTIVRVSGTEETGFLYKVEWFDNTFFRELSCANRHYSGDIKQQVIDFANRIDSNG